MDYYKPVRDQYIQKEMYPKEYRKDFFPKGAVHDSLVLGPKPPCAPRFVSKIEGNAVEEGARVFFEGIVDSQPQPTFTWYFDDEEIFPGERGWEELEIHHSRKMSTLIIKYAREHHMGKYTLAAQNKLGHDVCNCDLIVRKKQFPPVFWKRVPANVAVGSGSRLVTEVEVGGWPLPEVAWYKDNELVVSKCHTENYNGFPNKYVPERRIEVKRIDEIRHCLVFHRISESDSGVYACRAINPLGEAICEGEFIIEPGEGGSEELYLPELWRTGRRLTWKDEDARMKPFVGMEDAGLTPEDMADMAKRVASTPLPRAMNYFASLPDYKPTPLSFYGLVPMTFSPESGLKNVQPCTGKKGGTSAKPSRFVPGNIMHYGYAFDDFGRILPIWRNPLDRNAVDPDTMHYRQMEQLEYPPVGPRPPRAKSPDGPPVWESQATLDALREMLANSGFRLDLSAIRKDQLGNASQVRRQQQNAATSHLKEHAQARKNVMQNAKRGTTAPNKEWDERLNADVAGAQSNADDFTKQFMEQLKYSTTTTTETVDLSVAAPPLPPKTKIMFSPSRHVFSPTNEEQQQQQQPEFIPVKEKVRMIAQQQEEIEMRRVEEQEQQQETTKVTGETLKGGVRILPPSPVTVRREQQSMSPVTVRKETVRFSSQSPLTLKKEVDGFDGTTVMQQQSTGFTSSSSYSMYETSTISTSSGSMSTREKPSHIPVLEDKYNISENLEDLGSEDRTRAFQQQQITSSFSMGPSHHHQQRSHARVVPPPDQKSAQKSKNTSYCYVISSTQQGGTAATTGGHTSGGHTQTFVSSSSTSSQQPSRSTTHYTSSHQADGAAASGRVHPGPFIEEMADDETTSVDFEALVREQEAEEGERLMHHTEWNHQEISNRNGHDQQQRQPARASQSPQTTSSGLRQFRISQSPKLPEEDRVKYRNSPTAPFQPAFYKTPSPDAHQIKNPSFRLPSQRTKTSTDRWMGKSSGEQQQQQQQEEDTYDGDAEF